MKKLTRYHVLTALVVVMLLAVGGTLVASNMGFKLVDTKTFEPGNRNLFAVSVPHNSSYTKSEDFLSDQFDGTNTLTLVVYDNTVGGYRAQAIYSGYYGSGFSGLSIPLSPGQGFSIEISADLTTTIVGSQDPNYTHPARTYVAGNRNLFGVALTPNMTWTKSEDLLSAWFDGTNTLTLVVYDNTVGGYRAQAIYSGYYGSGFSGLSIPLTPGMGVDIEISADLGPQAQEPYY